MFVLLIALSAIAQAQDERNKVEFYGGYSYMRTDTGFDDDFDDFDDIDTSFNSHGFNASITGNPHRFAGVKFDFSTHSKSQSFSDGTDTATASFRTNQFLGGVQFKDNRKEGSRVRPFAHVLAGLANQRLRATGTFFDDGDTEGTGTPTAFDDSVSSNNFAMVFGAGVDVNLNKRVALRLIQVDFNPIFFRDQNFGDVTIEGRTQKNWRIGVGIVFH